MNLKSGDLYFINEVDVLTGQVSDFYKIGLVKDSRRGDAANRLDEHQTGNPRRLVIVESVASIAISDLEKSMHKRFARNQILGEWFVLTGAELASAIAKAKELSAEQSVHRDRLVRASELSRVESSEDVGEPTEDARQWHRRACVARDLTARSKVLKQRSDAFFKDVIDRGLDASLYAGWTTSIRKSFEKEKFAESHPTLFAEYQKEETKIAHRFLLQSGTEEDSVDVDEEFLEFERRFTEMLDRAGDESNSLEAIHLLHLELLGYQARGKWETELADANLKSLCGLSSSIDGLVKWGRKESTTSKLDDAALKKDHPEIHAQFEQSTEVRSFIVAPMRSYPIGND